MDSPSNGGYLCSNGCVTTCSRQHEGKQLASSKPDPGELRTLAWLLALPEDDARDALSEMLGVAPWLADALAEIEATPLEHWQAEHTRLFVNGHPKTPCPPFESAYRQGRMGGPVCADLQGLYARVGLAATAAAPPDYLGTMLECAAYLLASDEGTAADAEARGQVLASLWDEHLAVWVPRFAEHLVGHARLDLYRRLGARLRELFADEVGHD